MILINQSIKDSSDYDVPLAGTPIGSITEFLTPKMMNEMLALWLALKGFTKDGRIKAEFIEKDYFHLVEEYSYKTGYSQMIYITRKGITALGATFKTDFFSKADTDKILSNEFSVSTEVQINVEGKLVDHPDSPVAPGQGYRTYNGCMPLIDAAKLIVGETYGMTTPVADFMQYLVEKGLIDKYCIPSEKALAGGIFKNGGQLLISKWDNGSTTEEAYPLTLVTPDGLETLRDEWVNKRRILAEL